MMNNWMDALVETYDICVKDPSTRKDRVPLIPICHTLSNAQITVTIDKNGCFISADVIPKDRQNTLIPCTESSAGRTSGPCPHPLNDKLVYLVPDLKDHVHRKISPKFECSNELYMEQLRSWCNSEYSNTKVQLVLQYMEKGTLLDDLIQSGTIVLDPDGLIATKEQTPDAPLFSISKIVDGQQDAFIRWSVDIPGDPVTDTWEDDEIIQDWLGYVLSTQDEKGLCYLTGETIPLSTNSPSRLRNSGDGAKIISSNDTSGFTFRGRFENAEQAYGIGFVPVQKAHNALRWLIGRQGYSVGNLCILAWTVDGDEVKSPVDDYSDLLGDDDDSYKAMTGQQAAERIGQRLRGYNARILPKPVMILALDSAASGKGRISIVTFRHELGEDMVAGMEHWHESCAWIHTYAKVKGDDGKDKRLTFIGAPSPRDIAQSAYGSKADDAIVANTIKRILPCIMDGSRIPKDIMDSVVHRASMPQSMERWEWNKVLSIACSAFKQFSGGIYEMTLEKERTSRDYLYGRLLAIADLMEEAALRKAGEDRQTTAIRLMQRFSELPYSTWRDIELALVPYASRLGPELTGYYQGKIAEIMELFEGDDFRENRKLSGEFLLAYHCQRNDQFKKKNDKNNEVEE